MWITCLQKSSPMYSEVRFFWDMTIAQGTVQIYLKNADMENTCSMSGRSFQKLGNTPELYV